MAQTIFGESQFLSEALEALRELIRETDGQLAISADTEQKWRCLTEAALLIDEVLSDLKRAEPPPSLQAKVFDVLVLAGEGGAFGRARGP